MVKSTSFKSFSVLAIVILSSWHTLAQQKPDADLEYNPDGFGRTRDLTSASDLISDKSVFSFPGDKKALQPKYKLKRVIRKSSPVAPPKIRKDGRPALFDIEKSDGGKETFEQVGITVWRLERSEMEPTVAGTARMLVLSDGKTIEFIPKRVSADTPFSSGDRIRLSIESPRAGYVYVLDREILTNGKMGEPWLIFPTLRTRGGVNKITAGQILDIPDQKDSIPFFMFTQNNPTWVGEQLMIIVSPMPIKEFGVPSQPGPASTKFVEGFEETFSRDINEYEQDGTQGKAYTAVEKAVGGDATRQLTQDDPYPQTIFRVKTGSKRPLVITLPFKLGIR